MKIKGMDWENPYDLKLSTAIKTIENLKEIIVTNPYEVKKLIELNPALKENLKELLKDEEE